MLHRMKRRVYGLVPIWIPAFRTPPRALWRGLPPAALALCATLLPPASADSYALLSWNDLGMHCMNQYHRTFSVLPPFNNLEAQVIRRGSEGVLPELITSGVTIEYSIPGNTYSVGKTDFWTYDLPLFGVDLPPNIGLTGKGLTGTLDPAGDVYRATGIPITPFTDAAPLVEDPFQLAQLLVKDAQGQTLAQSTPTIPVSSEINCVSSGCHASEQAILNAHPDEEGFNPNARPILCASCHADPALGTQGNQEADWFSYRIHEKHQFIDNQLPGIDGCYKCHPGPNTECLRGTMQNDHGLICQDCHGDMHEVAESIDQGRTPWLEEPACRDCHTAQYGEPIGQLYRQSKGHGGVMCSACHHSTHADYPSREALDNANMIALQGHAGVLSDCTVCHGVVPSGAGPHGLVATETVEAELLSGASPLRIWPSPSTGTCTIEVRTLDAAKGKLLIFDAQGRTIRMLPPGRAEAGRLTATWDGRNARGEQVTPGIYFARWQDGARSGGAKITIAR
ncbi:MAG: hypothetical protein IPK72_23390 [Candidatus Eisenbacteria bacterium]|nr:hypothetical protein [Candidatus Eisenbacteria bacterium]